MTERTEPPYSIGSDHLPGLSKLVEELGEVAQVAGKIMDLGHMGQHWDGTNLKERLEDEFSDLCAAIIYFGERNALDEERMSERCQQKLELFEKWAAEHPPAPGEA